MALAEEAINAMPYLTMNPIEATYLGWINVKALNKKLKGSRYENAFELFLAHDVALAKGSDYGDADYLRINLACPHTFLREGLARMKKAIDSVA